MLNKVILQGRLVADPELRQTPQGTSVCSFRIACDRSFTPQGQERQADFFDIVTWRQQAEFVSRYFAKGRMILVEGNLRTRTYQDTRYPEVRHNVVEIYADSINFAGDKPAQGNSGSYAPPMPPDPYAAQPRQAAAPARAQAESAQPAAMSSGSFDDFEEVMGDEDKLPF